MKMGEYHNSIEERNLFIKFLRDRDYLTVFVAELHVSYVGRSVTLTHYLLHTRVSSFVSAAFLWEESINGRLYWEKVDNEWSLFRFYSDKRTM